MEKAEEIPEIRLCEVSNEVEAAMVVNLLKEEDIPARSDATASMSLFGGALPFEPGHLVFVPSSLARKAREILGHYPHFKNLRNVHEPEPEL
jgi:hypothetical protein